MCHNIPVTERLERDPATLPLAELLLTKLQIVELNERDATDAAALLHHHEVAADDDDALNADRGRRAVRRRLGAMEDGHDEPRARRTARRPARRRRRRPRADPRAYRADPRPDLRGAQVARLAATRPGG